MELERYRTFVLDFATATEAGWQLIRLVEERERPARSHLGYAFTVLHSMLSFADCILSRVPGIAPTSEGPNWDLATASVLARSLIEAHHMLCYVSFAPVSDASRDLRILILELHDVERRLKVLRLLESQDPQCQHLAKEASDKLQRILGHDAWGAIPERAKGLIKSGEIPQFVLTKAELDKECGVDQIYREIAWNYLSQYAHMLPMAVHHLSHFTPRTPDALHMISMPVQYSLGYLIRAIRRSAVLFNVSTEVSVDIKNRLETYQLLAELGVNEG